MTTAPVKMSDRSFGIMFSVMFALAYGIIWYFFGSEQRWLAGLAVVTVLTSLLYPILLLPFNRLWGRLGLRIAGLNNHLLLGLFFFLIILPMGLLMRLFGGDPMTRKYDRDAESYWSEVGRDVDSESLRDMF